MLMRTPPQVSLWPPWYWWARLAGIHAVAADVRRVGARAVVPVGDPDLVGQPVGVARRHPGVVEQLDARGGAGVHARGVAHAVQLVGPVGQEPHRRGRAGRGVGDVEALEVVEQRAAPGDAERLGRRDRALGLEGALRLRALVGVVGVGADRRVDARAVPREPGRARRLRAQRDRHQVPARAQLGGHPRGVQVGLGAAGPGVARDVDADGAERRSTSSTRSSRPGWVPRTGRSRDPRKVPGVTGLAAYAGVSDQRDAGDQGRDQGGHQAVVKIVVTAGPHVGGASRFSINVGKTAPTQPQLSHPVTDVLPNYSLVIRRQGSSGRSWVGREGSSGRRPLA